MAGLRPGTPLGVIALAAAALYLPSLWNGFVWDDLSQVLSNRWVTGWRYLPEIFGGATWDFHTGGSTNYYRPAMHVAYLAIWQLFGREAWPFHLLNLLLNAAASVLVGLLAGRVAARPGAAWRPGVALAAGLLFAVHPVHVEPVAWIAGLPDLGAATCALLAITLHLGAVRGHRPERLGPYLGGAAALFLGTLFKETALLAPLVLVASEAIFAPADPVPVRVRRLAPFAGAVALHLALRLAALGAVAPRFEHHGLGAGQLLLDVPVLFARYLWKLVQPLPLNAFAELPVLASPWSAAGLAAFAACGAFLLGGALAWRKDRAVLFGLVLLAVPLLPALYTPAISGGARFAERFLYLPSAGFAVAVALVASRLVTSPPRARLAGVALALAAGAGAVATAGRIPVWKDDLALWSDTVQQSPGVASPHYNLAVALRAQGDRAGAAAEFQAALERSPSPSLAALALTNLGSLELDEGRADRALSLFRQAVAANPRDAMARMNLGALLAEHGRLEEAVAELTLAVRLRPDGADARFNLAMALSDLGRLEQAQAELEEAARLAPGDAAIRARLEALRARRVGSRPPG